MRKLLGVVAVAITALIAGPGQAADFMDYPPIEIPEVDYGLQGSFYLRGSVGANYLWASDATYDPLCLCATVVSPVTTAGWGYSFGAGVGYETGDGLRFDVTVDQLNNTGLSDGTYTLDLRSTIAMANAYFDFPLGMDDYGMAAGGLGAYVGAGIGAAYNQTHITGGAGAGPDGANFTAAGALMAGVTYDMGSMVADLGYRLVYMPQVSNGSAALPPAASPYYINNATFHELRGTVRYRFN